MGANATEGRDPDRGLSDEFKISARGTWETHEAINRMAGIASANRAKATWGRRPGKAPVINAVLLYVDRLPRDVQSRILEDGMRILKATAEGAAEPDVAAEAFFAPPRPGPAPVDAASRAKDAKPRRRPG